MSKNSGYTYVQDVVFLYALDMTDPCLLGFFHVIIVLCIDIVGDYVHIQLMQAFRWCGI